MNYSCASLSNLAAVSVLCLCLSGCWTSQTRSKTVFTGTVGDMPVVLEASTDSESSGGVDTAKLLQGAVSAMRGDVIGAINSLKPEPVDHAGLYAGGAATAASVLALVLKLMSDVKYHKKDAAEGWDKATGTDDKGSNA